MNWIPFGNKCIVLTVTAKNSFVKKKKKKMHHIIWPVVNLDSHPPKSLFFTVTDSFSASLLESHYVITLAVLISTGLDKQTDTEWDCSCMEWEKVEGNRLDLETNRVSGGLELLISTFLWSVYVCEGRGRVGILIVGCTAIGWAQFQCWICLSFSMPWLTVFPRTQK